MSQVVEEVEDEEEEPEVEDFLPRAFRFRDHRFMDTLERLLGVE